MESIANLFSRLIESLPALLIILAVLFLALGLAGGIIHNDILPMPDTVPRVLAGVAGVALLGLAIYLSQTAPSLVLPKKEAYGITITRPQEANHVDIVTVEGTIKRKLPAEYTLEIMRMYPQGGFIRIGTARLDYKAGTWRASGCNIGGVPGDARIIGAFLVGPSGHALLEFFDQADDVLKIARSLAKKDDIYLPRLTTRTVDMIECAAVGVIRA